MTLVRYEKIDDHFADLPNRVLRGTLVPEKSVRALKKLLAAHLYVYNSITTVYDSKGRKMADRGDVEALYLLAKLIALVTADAGMDAQCLS